MITAMEIRNRNFNKSFRGFSEKEVLHFMSRIAQDYEALYSENARLKEKVQRLEFELEKYYQLEETMNNSLILAQQTADDVKKNAQRESALMLEDAKRRIAEVLLVYQEVIKRLNLFNTELRAQINGQLEMLEKNQRRTEELSSFFYSKDIKEIMEQLDNIELEGGQDETDS